MYVTCFYIDDQISSNNDTVIIGGTAGGLILLLTIVIIICVMILCMRRSRKGSLTLNDKVLYSKAKLSTDVTLQDNPSYAVNKAAIVDDNAGLNFPLTANPSYNICTKAYFKTNENGYEQANQHIQHLGFNDTIKMETNPSYGVSTREDSGTNFSAASDPNDYDYVTDDHFHSTIKIVESEANTKFNAVD